MSAQDTAGILGDGLPEEDWKRTLRIANERFAKRQADELTRREDCEGRRTIPEWKLIEERGEDER